MTREVVRVFDRGTSRARRPECLSEVFGLGAEAEGLRTIAATFGLDVVVELCDRVEGDEQPRRFRLTVPQAGAPRPTRVIVSDSGAAVPDRRGLGRSLARHVNYELCARGLTRVAARVLALALDDIDEAAEFTPEVDLLADLTSALRVLSGTSGPPAFGSAEGRDSRLEPIGGTERAGTSLLEWGRKASDGPSPEFRIDILKGRDFAFDHTWKGALSGVPLTHPSSPRTPLLAAIEWDLALAGGPRLAPAAVATRLSAAAEALHRLSCFPAPWVPDGVRDGIGELAGLTATAAARATGTFEHLKGTP